ncbi:hypothetical protein [Nocardia gamkensis]|uniref:hypothetical protein n=1 Tax=Nocardia gamkensis TaxID=352869 RepID=UPI001FE157F2|nr:hypothetical protein [Nocardia gamkensis]NQE67398.1 hypothetical protein [Nocardia gamkensis]
MAAEATRQDRDRAAAAAVVKAHMREFGVDKIDELSEKKLAGLVEDREDRIANDPSLSGQDKIAKLERLHEMRDNARDYNRLGTEKVLTSKEMGELGGISHATDRPDAVLLTPFENAVDGRDTFDVVSFTDHPPTLIVDECKGGTSPLGAANTENGRAQQGSREYAERTAAIEKNLQRLLSETPEQMRERGLDPNSPEGQQFLKARDQLLRAHADGTLQVEYNLVHVARDGTVAVAQFNLGREGQPFSLEILGGIDKSRAFELVERRELEQSMGREMEELRVELLQSLHPEDRELVLDAVDFALDNAVPGRAVEESRAHILEAIDRLNAVPELDPGQVSRELFSLYERLDQVHELENGKSQDILVNLNLEASLKEVAMDLVAAEIVDRDRAVIANLQVIDRGLITNLTQQIADATQVPDREKLLAQAVERVNQLTISRGSERGVDLTHVLEAHNAIEQIVSAEREHDSRTIEAIGLSPEHAAELSQAVTESREERLVPLRDAVARETIREHNLTVEQNMSLRVPEGREASFDARIYLLCLEHEPSGFDSKNHAFVYELPGREPIQVPYDSLAARLADASKAIERGLSIDHAALVHLTRISQAAPAQEAVRTLPTAEELTMRGRSQAAARERERGLSRGL